MAKFEIWDDSLVREEPTYTCEGGISYCKRTTVITKEEFIACYKAWIIGEDPTDLDRTCSKCGWCQTSDYADDDEDTLVCANGACENCGRVLGSLKDGIVDVKDCKGFEPPL